MKKIFVLLPLMFLLALAASPQQKASAWLITPCNYELKYIEPTNSAPARVTCRISADASAADITIPVPSIAGHHPNLAIVGVPYAFAISWDNDTISRPTSGVDGIYTGTTDMEFGFIKYIGLRSSIQVRVENVSPQSPSNHRQYSKNRTIQTAPTPDQEWWNRLFPLGLSKEFTNVFIDEAYIERTIPFDFGGYAGERGCLEPATCGRKDAISGFLPVSTFTPSSAYYPDLPAGERFFISPQISSYYAGGNDGPHGEPAIHLEVSSQWSVWGKLMWTEVQKYSPYWKVDYYIHCGPDIDPKDGIGDLECEVGHWVPRWVYFAGSGGTEYEQIIEPFTIDMVSAPDNPLGQYAPYYPVEIIQSQPLLEKPQW